MGMQRGPWARGSLGRIRGAGEVSGVSAGLHWAVLGQTGMAWGVVAMRGEGVTAAELLVPTRGVFRMSTPTCRETRRPRWSLGCPRCQQEMGGPKCPPVPRGDALQSQHPTHLPEIILGSFQECLGKDNKGLVRIGPCGAGGGHTGAGSRAEAKGWEFRASKEICLELGGDPKTLTWGKLRSQGMGLGVWKGHGGRYGAGERNCSGGTWERKGGAWWGQRNRDGRGQK